MALTHPCSGHLAKSACSHHSDVTGQNALFPVWLKELCDILANHLLFLFDSTQYHTL